MVNVVGRIRQVCDEIKVEGLTVLHLVGTGLVRADCSGDGLSGHPQVARSERVFRLLLEEVVCRDFCQVKGANDREQCSQHG